jgi:hypothetical protein
MKGKYVFVRTCGDILLKRMVWEVVGGVVVVVSDDGFRRLERGDKSFIPPGFRTADVFLFDPSIREGKFRRFDKLKPIRHF